MMDVSMSMTMQVQEILLFESIMTIIRTGS